MLSRFSVQHNTLSFEFPKRVRTLGPPAIDRGTQKRIKWAFAFICFVHRNNILEKNNFQMTATFNMMWMKQQPKEFYATGIGALLNDGIRASTYWRLCGQTKTVSK
ncbi:hypothetical protein TNCT_658991 [Trichonephila clavata]|uniref:Uncharacterized protein n=1 Tax=Trichonephila clavata TaxID=2740835 RepID=A0A8X6IAX4_TRICU|nr:hypothetical protein TNCT_658991 [Trichonephila clavata]